MPNVSLTDPISGTVVASGLIATNNGNLRALLNGGIDYLNMKGAPALVSGETYVWNGTQHDRSSVTRITANGLAGLSALVTGVAVTSTNVDLTWQGGFSANVTYDIGTVGGTLRSIAASSQGVGTRLVLRNGAGSALTLNHNVTSGTGLALYFRDTANLSLGVGETVEFVQSGTLWIEVNRDRLITLIAPTHLPGMNFASAVSALTANQAYLIPIPNVVTPTSISRIAFYLDASSGNMDLGIYYSDDEATFTRLFSQGSFATPAAGNNSKAITAQVITPVTGRRWYYAAASDNGTSTFKGSVPGTGSAWLAGGFFKATSFPLPASLTAMTAITNQFSPSIHGLV